MNCIKMPINELINLEELFQKYNIDGFNELKALAKSVLFDSSIIIEKANIKLIRKKYKSIKEIFTGDNQIMAEIHFYDGPRDAIRNGYICDVPKEHIGKYRKVLIS